MRAARIHKIGGTPQVDTVDEPRGDSVVAITSAALNPVDVAIGSGRFYGGTPDVPYVIGSEAIGLLPDGRRVWHYQRGAMAERTPLTDPDLAADVPEGLDDGLALACGIAGLTGWLAVSWRAPVTPEDTVLVLGASGTLGAAATQGAKLLGAKRVIGASRRTERISAAADEVVQVDGSETYPEATVIVDGLWGAPFEKAFSTAAAGVRVVQLGQSAGATAKLESGWVRGKLANILGHSLHAVPADVRAAAYGELCGHALKGEVHFDVETYGLDRIAEAWERQSSGSPGAKIVISIRS